VITAHAGLRGYRGVWFFVRGRSAVVSAPAEWVARLEQNLDSTDPGELLAPATARRILGHAAGEIVGPSFQGWLAEDRLRPVASEGVRRVAEPEAALLAPFHAACSPEEWEHAGIDAEAAEVWVLFQGTEAAALGQLRLHPGGAVDPCVITHPAHRRRGHALRLVGAMAHEALVAGQLVLYQTLVSNRAAVSLALLLGFEQYATLLAVRIAPDTG
jgi:ribosomal protein S18 acetylase RimI-like enzyme